MNRSNNNKFVYFIFTIYKSQHENHNKRVAEQRRWFSKAKCEYSYRSYWTENGTFIDGSVEKLYEKYL